MPTLSLSALTLSNGCGKYYYHGTPSYCASLGPIIIGGSRSGKRRMAFRDWVAEIIIDEILAEERAS